MALIPAANVTVDDTAGTFSGNTGYLVLAGCCEKNADGVPRVFGSQRAMFAQHGYSQSLDYAALHIDETRSPVVFIGMPTATPGTIGRQNATGVLGTSVISVAAGPAGVLEETDAILVVTSPGTIGTPGVQFSLSMDGGRTSVAVRLGTANSYTVPFLGIVLNFGAGTLLAGDRYTFSTTAPLFDSAGVAAVRTALAAQTKLARSALFVGDVPDATLAGAIVSAMNSYETANQRYLYARVQVRDQLPLASKSRTTKIVTGAPSLTFATTTITRSAGSFLSDGFAIGDMVTPSGTASNNSPKGPLTAVSATVLTFAAGGVAEGPIAANLTGSEGLVFTTTTITRSAGSWLADGFRVGDSVTTTGSASNNNTRTITALSATVMTFAGGGSAETISSATVTMTKGETASAYVALMDTTFAGIDSQKRVDLGLGRGRKTSLITNWALRRPCQWAFSIREYQHDLHIPAWRKIDGPFSGWDMNDAANAAIVEYDERSISGALAARFTCFRTYGNGPNGTFGALSLTRAPEGSLLSRTHNMAVANLACTTVQASTEYAIGLTLELDATGRGTDKSLQQVEESVNTDLANALLRNTQNEGARATRATWRASRTDVLNVPGAILTGVLDLQINGTLEQINTAVRVH